jgi:hypothetical protein
MTTMLSETASAHAASLRALLEDGVLSAAGMIETAPGVFEPADVVVEQTLAALDEAERARAMDPEQLRRLEMAIERLYREVKLHV